MHRHLLCFAFSLMIGVAGPVLARDLTPDTLAAVDQLVEARLANGGAPGFALALLTRGETAPIVRNYGIGNLEQSAVLVDSSVFPIASITKTFTAVAILLLEQEGKLAVTDPLARFLPDFPNAEQITLHQLLVHTSGIAEFTSLPAFAGDQERDWTPQQLLEMIAAAPPLKPPGVACVYSDSGYILLGLVIEKASGMSYLDFVHERVGVPLGAARLAGGSHVDLVPHRVGGYTHDGETWHNAPYVSLEAPWAAGGLWAPIAEMIQIARVLWRDGPLIEPANRAAMTAPVILEDGKRCKLDLPGAVATYGYGLEIVTFDDLATHRAVGKSGVFPGYSGYYAIFDGSDLAIAALANADDSLAFTVETVHLVAKLLLDGGAGSR